MTINLVEPGSEYLYVANNGLLSGLSAMSCAGWFWPDSLSDPAHRQTILQAWWRTADGSLHRQALLRCVGTAVQCFVMAGGSQYGGNIGKTAATGSMQHFAMTYDGSTLIGYLDGVAGGTTYSPSGNIATDTNNLALGRHGNLYNDGDALDRGIWDRALSATEVADVYTYKLRCDYYPVGLIHHWPLDVHGRAPSSGTAAQANDFGFRDRVAGLTALIGNAAGWAVDREPPLNMPNTNME